MRIKVLHLGLGPIGVAAVRQVAARKSLITVGAVDSDPDRVGRELADVCRLRKKIGVRVSDDIAKTVKAAKPDVALVCTSSSLRKAAPELEALLKLKVFVVATTEELAYPVKANRALAKRLDGIAKRSRVAIVGTGVNPGFAMDVLPITLTAVCQRVDAIDVERFQDASARREPFQKQIGVGMSRDEFADKVKEGGVGHAGMAESITMIADAMNWKLDRVANDVEPKMLSALAPAPSEVSDDHVVGIVQRATGYVKDKPAIRLRFEAYVGAPESVDVVRIEGVPPLEMKIAGGIPADTATASLLVNSIPKILEAAPGLRTMRELKLPSYYGG